MLVRSSCATLLRYDLSRGGDERLRPEAVSGTKMRAIEKRFVNSPDHSDRVAREAERRVRQLDPQPGQRLLDVGCGNGAAVLRLARMLGLEVVGIDVDPEQIGAATLAALNTPNAHFVVADATDLPFPNGHFDLVYTNKTTHHVHDWEQAITEMARVLKPGGHLLYNDFVAPIGRRFPTRRGLNRLASEHQLEPIRQQSSPFHYNLVLRAPTNVSD
jgi:ubiquinone/menaquinone biosynthesis C-methylase UbiE